MTKTQDLIQPRVASYLKSAWYARWGVVGIVAASYLVVPDVNRRIITVLLAAAVAYNLFLFAGARVGLKLVSNRALILLIDGLMALTLVICSGDVSSPYLVTLAFMIISGAYWYGGWVAVFIGAIQSVLLLGYYMLQNGLSASFPKDVVVRMLLMVTVGIYVSLLTRSDRSERRALIDLGTETEKERQQLLALINNMRDAVFVVDNSENIVIYNQAASSLAGKHQDLHGQPFDDTVSFEDSEHQSAELKLRRAAEAFERRDLSLRAPDNSLLSVLVSVAPYIVDRQNRGHVLIIHDISQDKTVDQERKEFVAVASHELRTPLTIAQGDISLLLAPPYLPQNQEAVGMLNGALRSLQQLSHIIKDLTNLSQVENKELEVELEPLNPVTLLHEFEADYTDQAKSKGLALKIKIDPDLGSSTILTSRYVVREILSIFISNAIKFTDKGLVTLSIMNPEDGSLGVTFSIADTGIGISQSDQKKIFEKFFQSEDYATRVHGGTGLGLYIAKQLAGRITARLWYETKLGEGSVFYIWVPAYSEDKQDRGKVAAAETKDFFNTV
ncbi:MAG TPA: ATP-binding protein [Candidatus Saccharimonadales bacterium]